MKRKKKKQIKNIRVELLLLLGRLKASFILKQIPNKLEILERESYTITPYKKHTQKHTQSEIYRHREREQDWCYRKPKKRYKINARYCFHFVSELANFPPQTPEKSPY